MKLGVFLLALAAAVAITGRALQATREPADAGERKIAASKRFLYYVTTPVDGPEFRLSGGERELHIVSHALLPGAPPYDPARQLVYGLQLTLIEGGQEVWRRDLYTRSRQSKARREGGLWLDEGAFSLERGVQVTDERLIVARLPEDARAGETLRVRLVGPDAREALVRVYDRAPRLAARVALRLRSLSPQAREELAEDLSYTPWDRLSTVERTARLRFQRLRMPALGHEGESYRTRALYVSDFRLPLETSEDEAAPGGLIVTPARGAALNLVGPVELRLEVTRGPSPVPSLVPAALALTWIGEGGQPAPISIPVPPAPVSTVQTLEVPAGLHSLHLGTDAREGVRVNLTAPPAADAQLGVPQLAGAPQTLAPQEVMLPGHVLDATSPPLVVSLPGPTELLARVIRVDVRILPPPAPPGSAVSGDVTVDMIDGAGHRLSRQPVRLSSVVSSFEEVRLVGETRLVAEPASFRLIAPPAATRIEIRAAQPIFARAHALATLNPEPDTLAPPFDAVQLVTSVWRYAPFDERSWIPVQPQNRAELTPREARLAAQVRLEPAPPIEIVPGAAAQTVAPEGAVERQVMLEHEDSWGEGHHTVLRPGRAQRATFGGPARLSLWVLGPPELNLGKEVTVSLDGARAATFTVSATRASVALPEVTPGVHTITATTDAPHLRLLLDQPPSGGGEIVALRGVYRVTGPLRVRVVKPAGRPASLDAVIYATSRDGDPRVRFKVTIDGGNPRRAEGVALAQITPGTRTLTLPPADRPAVMGFADIADRTVYHPRLIAVSLGDDVGAGAHTITIQPVGAHASMWMRFFVMTTSKSQPERAIQWRLLPRAEGPNGD